MDTVLRLSGLRDDAIRLDCTNGKTWVFAGRASLRCPAGRDGLVKFEARTDNAVNTADQHHQAGFKVAV